MISIEIIGEESGCYALPNRRISILGSVVGAKSNGESSYDILYSNSTYLPIRRVPSEVMPLMTGVLLRYLPLSVFRTHFANFHSPAPT